jgi:parvulin-like peptidyl-prolyl isomerase
MKDKYLTARHILIAAQRGDTAAVAVAQKTTDSIMGLINSGNFEDFVQNYSEDPGSKDKGGKYEDFLDGEMVPEFSNFAMDEPIGKIGYVQTDYGFHIMEVLERKPANVPNLAIVQKTLKPSEETLQELEDQAYTLLEKLYSKVGATKGKKKKIAKFDTIVKRAGSIARPIVIMDNDPKMDGAGFTSAFAETEIYKLAFGLEAKVGDIISSPIKDGDRWIVAILSEIKVKGEAKFSDVRSIVEAEYIKQVKFERFKKQMKGKSLESIQKAKNGVVQQGEIIFGTAQLNRSYSFEPEVVGALFSGLKDGKMTAPIKGKQGVFVVRIDKTVKAPEAKDFDQEKEQLIGTRRGGLSNLSSRALVKQAEIVDNRKFFEIGVRR